MKTQKKTAGKTATKKAKSPLKGKSLRDAVKRYEMTRNETMKKGDYSRYPNSVTKDNSILLLDGHGTKCTVDITNQKKGIQENLENLSDIVFKTEYGIFTVSDRGWIGQDQFYTSRSIENKYSFYISDKYNKGLFERMHKPRIEKFFKTSILKIEFEVGGYSNGRESTRFFLTNSRQNEAIPLVKH